MKINHIKINGFGKLKNKEINFENGINIVCGKNESGKSTILKFLTTMLYGASKNKNGKSISDFDKYKPWNGTEFSGKIQYTLDNEEKYEVFREFKKKNPVIYNEFGEDISKEFTVGKGKEIDFFEQQINVEESVFSNTAVISQQEVKLEKNDTNHIVQKISNLVSTGDDNISYKKSLDKINKMQNENIGTERTKQRPLNIVNSKITELLQTQKKLNDYQENVNTQLQKNKELNSESEVIQNKKEFLKEVKEWFDELKIKDVEIDFEKNLQKEYLDKVKQIEEKINSENETTENKHEKIDIKRYIFFLVFFIILNALVTVFMKNIWISLALLMPIIAIGIIIKTKNKKELAQLKDLNQELEKEHENAKNIYTQKKKELEQKEKKFEAENNKIQKTITDKYKKKIDISYIEKILEMDSTQIDNEIEVINESINQINLKIHLLETEKQNTDEKLEQLLKVEEELNEQKKIKEELLSLNVSYEIAKECIEKAYEEIKHSISPKFEKNLCHIIHNIIDGKYSNITLNDENGICVEVENGSYMPVDRLSIGTIDEMYLSLRLSALKEISNEKLPIILDETFAYFDNERLKNILIYLQEKYQDSQIIIFTCSNREEDALKDLKIEYNRINLEK